MEKTILNSRAQHFLCQKELWNHLLLDRPSLTTPSLQSPQQSTDTLLQNFSYQLYQIHLQSSNRNTHKLQIVPNIDI